VSASLGGCASTAQKDTSPNVLWVITDQWRGQATGYAGDVNAVTPNLDRLASEALRFDRAFSSHPLCVPFRGALLTGQRGIRNGVTGHASSLSTRTRTVAHAMRDLGYLTAWFGKWHLGDHIAPRGMVSEVSSRWIATRVISKERRGGFQHWEAFEGGNIMRDPWIHTDRDNRPQRRPGYQPDVVFDACATFAEAHADDDEAWFAVCSVEPPHDPYDTAPYEYASRYDPDSITLRPNVPLVDPVNLVARSQLAGYYAHIEATDAAFGRLLQRVEAAGSSRPTAVFFMSDHGDMLGSHGQYKKTKPYEESVRIPLIIRWPEARSAGRTTNALICEIDIVPTLLGLLERPEALAHMDGISFARHFDDSETPGPEYVLLSHIDGLGHSDAMTVPWRAVRTHDALFGVTENEECWLFDLLEDPYETRNLAKLGSGAALRERMLTILQKALSDAGDPFRIPPTP
jgi:arylsulfatase A-like enzyme